MAPEAAPAPGSPLVDALAARFAAREATAMQGEALARFLKQGLPHRRIEGWRWSDIGAALRTFDPAKDARAVGDAPTSSFAGLNPIEIRVVDGRISPPAEYPTDGVGISLSEHVAAADDVEAHALASLTVALSRRALEVAVSPGRIILRPFLFRHILTGGAVAQSSIQMRIGEGAAATIIETFETQEAAPGGFSTSLFRLELGAGATAKRYVFQASNDRSVFWSMLAASVDAGARLEQASVTTGGRYARHESSVRLIGREASAKLDSVSLVEGDRHADFTSSILHLAERCVVRQRHRGVVDGKGRSVFQGKFKVARGGQRADADMQASALLISDAGQANHKPELEIYADDVQCAHGSTCGALDEAALFYLRQRGLDESAARALLIDAFVGEVIDDVDEIAQPAARAIVDAWLKGRSK